MSDPRTYPLTVKYELDDEWVDTLVEMAGYGIGYWATSASVSGRTYTVVWHDPDPSGKPVRHQRTLTYGGIVRAVQRILSDPDDTRVGPHTLAAVYQAMLDDGEVDADVADVVVQVALFGHVIYG